MRLCADGLIRLSLDELLMARLVHLASGIDDQLLHREHCGRPTRISGYTEWVSPCAPRITLSWDWHISTGSGHPRWQRIDEPRSNVMVVDNATHDVGWSRNAKLLSALVDAMPWSDMTSSAIVSRYG